MGRMNKGSSVLGLGIRVLAGVCIWGSLAYAEETETLPVAPGEQQGSEILPGVPEEQPEAETLSDVPADQPEAVALPATSEI